MRVACVAAAAALIVASVTSVASAQQRVPKPARLRISLNAGTQPQATTFTGTTTAPMYLETLTVITTYRVPAGQLLDGGVLLRVTRRFAIGAAASSFKASRDADVTGTAPHPFFYSTLRPFSGTASGLERKESVIHAQLAYMVSSKRMSLVLSGGPSFFTVDQDLVQNVTYSETYPYDSVTFTAAAAKRTRGKKTGFNAGADIGFTLAPHLGVGALVRVARAQVPLALTGSAAGVTVDAGGTQVGGGLRIFF